MILAQKVIKGNNFVLLVIIPLTTKRKLVKIKETK